MKTVQRSPRRIGAADCRARSANSPTMSMPSFSACSSRNEPVPAAQASFMAKSTTMPSCMEMNLESWPPISKMVSTWRAMLRLMKSAPVLWAVISSVIRSAPQSSPMSSRPEPVVPDAEHADAVADLVADLGEAGVDHLDRTRLRLGVDRLDHLARLVEHDQVGRDGADVDAEVGVDDRLVGRELVGPRQVAQQQHVARWTAAQWSGRRPPADAAGSSATPPVRAAAGTVAGRARRPRSGRRPRRPSRRRGRARRAGRR